MKNFFYSVIIGVFVVFFASSCKKNKYASFQVSITSDQVLPKKVSVGIKEIWLNYTTKKSNSEWMKLEVDSSRIDLAHLYNDGVDTLFIPEVRIDKIKTLLKFRVVLNTKNNSVITQNDDTLSLALVPEIQDGIKASVNKALENQKMYAIKLILQPDSLALNAPSPLLKTTIGLKSFEEKAQ
ncbi:MAG: hypothetical protein M9916_13320 [Crocinitomicaceae bacterium]|nr:hypothetical protein [Crocinitomicaceae bacterium]